MSVVPPEVEVMVRQDDVEIVSLSEEQCAVLWFDEELDQEILAQPRMRAGLRSLVAAGLVELDADDRLELHGPAVMVRSSRDVRRRTLVWLASSGPAPLGMWTLLSPTVLLEQLEVFPGVYRFTLRNPRRAAMELASDLLVEGPELRAEPIAWADDSSALALVRETLSDFPVESRILILDSGPLTQGDVNTSAVLDEMTLWTASGPERGPGWGVRREPGSVPIVAPIDRKAFRRWMLDVLLEHDEI